MPEVDTARFSSTAPSAAQARKLQATRSKVPWTLAVFQLGDIETVKVNKQSVKDLQASKPTLSRSWGLTPVILPNQEAEIRKIAVRSQPGQIVCEILSLSKKTNKKNPSQKSGSKWRPRVQIPVPQKKK
jgi:hypothetical protein